MEQANLGKKRISKRELELVRQINQELHSLTINLFQELHNLTINSFQENLKPQGV